MCDETSCDLARGGDGMPLVIIRPWNRGSAWRVVPAPGCALVGGADLDRAGADGVDADRDGQGSRHSGGGDCDDAGETVRLGVADPAGDLDQDCDGADG